MATLDRIRVAMAGFPGAPGVMTFYASDALTFVDPLHAWLIAIATAMPTDVQLTIESQGDVIEDQTGTINGTWTTTVGATVPGLSTGSYAAPCGYVAEWLTSGFFSGRRLRGRTFVVPLGGASYFTDGTILDGSLADFRAAAATLVTSTAGNFRIWQRPRKARPADGTHPAVTARVGGSGAVSSSRIPDKVAVLRSRRD